MKTFNYTLIECRYGGIEGTWGVPGMKVIQ